MSRIAIFEGVGGAFPNKSDFEKYNANILITRMLTFHVLKNNDNVNMLQLCEIEAIARENKVNTHLKEMICRVINEIPENCWQKIIEELHFKQLNQTR